MDVGHKERQRVERRIARSAIRELIEANFEITVNDGEEDVVERSQDDEEVYGAMFSTDEDYLIVHLPGQVASTGWVRFIYGNDGPDVINDFTVNLEPSLAATLNFAEAEEERLFG